MQVDPIKPTLKAPGTMRLKLKHGKPLSSFAFNPKLRRYRMAANPAAIAEARRGLRERMLASPLCDSEGFVRGRGSQSSTFQLNLTRFCHSRRLA